MQTDLGFPSPDAREPQTDLGFPSPEAREPQTDLGFPSLDAPEPQTDLGIPLPDAPEAQTDLGIPSPDARKPQTDLGFPSPDKRRAARDRHLIVSHHKNFRTMSNILDIPQVPTFDPGNLQNDLHIGFGTDISQRFKAARWTDETHAKKTFPDNVDAEIGAYLNAFSVENQAYVIAQKSQIVKQRTQVDHERDALYKEVRKTVDTFATLSIFPAKQSAALLMQPVMQKYKIDPDGGIEAQTVATEQWLEEQMVNYQLELAARELGIFESIQQLKTLNDEVRRLTLAHNDENAQKALAALKTARTETDRAYRALMLVMNASAVILDDSELYTELIKSIQQTIKYYRSLSEQRRKANVARREKKKDDKGGDTPEPTPEPEPEPEPEPTPEPTPEPDPSGDGE